MDADLNVYYWFCRQARYGRRSDVVYAHRPFTERSRDAPPPHRESPGPGRAILGELDRIGNRPRARGDELEARTVGLEHLEGQARPHLWLEVHRCDAAMPRFQGVPIDERHPATESCVQTLPRLPRVARGRGIEPDLSQATREQRIDLLGNVQIVARASRSVAVGADTHTPLSRYTSSQP
jgi:hypothetical protein